MPKITSVKEPITVWAGDIHSNSTVAVSPPESYMDDEVPVGQSKAQAALWSAWLDAWQQIKDMKRNVIVIFGGEICDIDGKSRSNQYITKNPEHAQANALKLIEPVMEIASKFIVLRGTEAHVGESSWTDESIARQIHKSVEVVKNGRQYSWYEGDFFIGGRKYNLSHHVGMGQSKRTERDAANHLSADLMMAYARSGDKFPDFAIRGHVHRVADSSFNFPIRSLIAPCWTLQTSYIHRIGHGHNIPEIGLLWTDPATKHAEVITYDLKRSEPKLV